MDKGTFWFALLTSKKVFLFRWFFFVRRREIWFFSAMRWNGQNFRSPRKKDDFWQIRLGKLLLFERAMLTGSGMSGWKKEWRTSRLHIVLTKPLESLRFRLALAIVAAVVDVDEYPACLKRNKLDKWEIKSVGVDFYSRIKTKQPVSMIDYVVMGFTQNIFSHFNRFLLSHISIHPNRT